MILRTDGRVRYLAINRSTQLVLALLLGGFLLWSLLATAGYVRASLKVATRAETINHAHSRIDSLLAEQAALEKQLDGLARYDRNIAGDGEQHAADLEEVREANAALRQTLESNLAVIAELKAARQTLDEDRASLQDDIDALASHNSALVQQNADADWQIAELQRSLSEDRVSREKLVAERDLLRIEIDSLARQLESVVGERNAISRERQALIERADAMNRELEDLLQVRESLQPATTAADVVSVGTAARSPAPGGTPGSAPGDDDANRTAGYTAGHDESGPAGVAALQTLRTVFETEVASLQRELADNRGEMDRLQAERDSLQTRLAGLQQQAAQESALRRPLHARLEKLESELTVLQEERDDLQSNRNRLTSHIDTLRGEISRLGTANDRLEQELAAHRRDRSALVNRVAFMEGLLGRGEADGSHGVLTTLQEQAESDIARMNQLLAMTGLDTERLLRRAGLPEPGHVGGPFVAAEAGDESPVGQHAPSGQSALSSQIEWLDSQLRHWAGLRQVMERLPLAAPMEDYRITSGFGRRKDPFTGRFAMHQGTDFVGPGRAQIVAPAPGRVTFVGWKGGYGKMVEIDHGHGVISRYAHLRTIFVEAGEEVAFRQRLGRMGSTGRSTGEHLHYEVIVDGQPVDTELLIRAGTFAFAPLPDTAAPASDNY